MNKILLIEDDKSLASSLSKYLSEEGFSVESIATFEQAMEKLNLKVDAIILDWMLPDGQGLDFLRSLRKINVSIPVILLTARTQLTDKIVGLEVGANDYMTKPFEPRELIARLRVHIRTYQSLKLTPAKPIQILQAGGIQLNASTREVSYLGKAIDLTKMEYLLLKLFLENQGRVFPREELLNQVWGLENYPTTRTIDNHVLQLRQKFDSSYFETFRGTGYRFKVNS